MSSPARKRYTQQHTPALSLQERKSRSDMCVHMKLLEFAASIVLIIENITSLPDTVKRFYPKLLPAYHAIN